MNCADNRMANFTVFVRHHFINGQRKVMPKVVQLFRKCQIKLRECQTGGRWYTITINFIAGINCRRSAQSQSVVCVCVIDLSHAARNQQIIYDNLIALVATHRPVVVPCSFVFVACNYVRPDRTTRVRCTSFARQ